MDDDSKLGFTQWSPFPADTNYFDPSPGEFMLNYGVENLTELVTALKAEGITILDDIEEYEYGKFVHILDNEGKIIELWEPVDTAYDKLVEGRTQ